MQIHPHHQSDDTFTLSLTKDEIEAIDAALVPSIDELEWKFEKYPMDEDKEKFIGTDEEYENLKTLPARWRELHITLDTLIQGWAGKIYTVVVKCTHKSDCNKIFIGTARGSSPADAAELVKLQAAKAYNRTPGDFNIVVVLYGEPCIAQCSDYLDSNPDGYRYVLREKQETHKTDSIRRSDSLPKILSDDPYAKGVMDTLGEVRQLCADYCSQQGNVFLGDVLSSLDSLQERLINKQ